MKTLKSKLIFVGGIYAVPIVLNVLAAILGFRY